jgi:hypothetical protein
MGNLLDSPGQGLDPTSNGLDSLDQGLDPTSNGLDSRNQRLDPTSNGLDSPDQGLDPTSNGLDSPDQRLDPTSEGLGSLGRGNNRVRHELETADCAIGSATCDRHSAGESVIQTGPRGRFAPLRGISRR